LSSSTYASAARRLGNPVVHNGSVPGLVEIPCCARRSAWGGRSLSKSMPWSPPAAAARAQQPSRE
jgi:hypothetical protein